MDGGHWYRVGERGLLAHNASANPNNLNILVDSSTNTALYKATDRTNPNYFIRWSLAGGVLEFTVIAKIPGQTGSVSGQNFFAAMMAHFAPGAVKMIKSHWIAGNRPAESYLGYCTFSWSALTPEEQDALYGHLTIALVLSQGVEVLSRLVERLQEKICEWEQNKVPLSTDGNHSV